MKNGLVYGLFCPIEKRIVYIGKTTMSAKKKLRLCKIHHNASYSKWMDNLRKAGCIDKVELCVVESGISDDMLSVRQEYWIGIYSDNNLLFNRNKSPRKYKRMSASSFSMFRYFLIDNLLLANGATLGNLIRACSGASKRTIQLDLEDMRYDDGLGFFAPIVYDKGARLYKYSDSNYSILKVIQQRFYNQQNK